MRRFFVLLSLLVWITGASAEEAVRQRKVAGSFDEVKEALTMAIESRGLVVNYVSHIGDMLERTGADLGKKQKIFAKAEIVEFCSAGLSRQMMEMDAHHIVMCPFSISIYVLPGDPSHVWLSYRQPFGKAAKIVGDMLEGLVSEAAKP